jgi:hypothetical protein
MTLWRTADSNWIFTESICDLALPRACDGDGKLFHRNRPPIELLIPLSVVLKKSFQKQTSIYDSNVESLRLGSKSGDEFSD